MLPGLYGEESFVIGLRIIYTVDGLPDGHHPGFAVRFRVEKNGNALGRPEDTTSEYRL